MEEIIIEVPKDASNPIILFDNHYGYRLYYDNNKFNSFLFDCKYIDLSDGNWKISKIEEQKITLIKTL